jgi:hypothetical protein
VEPGLLEHQDTTWALFGGCTFFGYPQWGVRNLEAVVAAAEEQGLVWVGTAAMPTNNLSVVFKVGLDNR